MPHYAAHYVQIGSLRAKYPWLQVLAEGHYHLEPFTEECAETIFLSGTLRLHNRAYPLSEVVNTELAPLATLQDLLAQHQDWELILPSEV